MLRFANTLSVLPKHFLFSSVGPVHPYRRETMSRLHTEKLSRNRRLQENMESHQNLFLCALSIAPPFFPIQFLPVGKTLGYAIFSYYLVKPSLGKLGKNPQQKP